MRDFCPIKRIDHIELYVGNARQAAVFYETCFGFRRTAYRGLETGCRDSASYVLEQGDIRFVLTSPLGPDHPVAQFIHHHGDGVGIIALQVPDAAAAFRGLIDLGIKYGGSYYLTYHRFATKEQVETCYPQFREFLERKLKYDPQELFQSTWYRHYRQLFGLERV